MMIVLSISIYIIIWFIFVGILKALGGFEDFETFLFGLIWPITIIIAILIAITEISEKITKKVLRQ